MNEQQNNQLREALANLLRSPAFNPFYVDVYQGGETVRCRYCDESDYFQKTVGHVEHKADCAYVIAQSVLKETEG